MRRTGIVHALGARTVHAGLAGALAVGLLVAPALVAPSSAAGRPLPSYVQVPPKVRQMVTVTSPGWHTTHARLRVWRRPRGGPWHLVRGPLHARLGYNGWVRGLARRQSTGTSPAGKYALPRAFGSRADPGGPLPYRRIDRNDFWPYEPRDPRTYNIYQGHKASTTHWRRDYGERLWDFRDQYRYAAVVGYNLPTGVHYSARRHQRVARRPSDTDRGGGIFLHVADGGPTAGCVSMRVRHIRFLVRWLDPARHPRVVMGPVRYVKGL